MKFILTIFILALAFETFGQVKPDTLFIGGKKYALHKTKIFHDISQRGPILLPSEYKNPKEDERLEDRPYFKYKIYQDSSYEWQTWDNGPGSSGEQIGLMVATKSCDSIKGGTYHLRSLVDTLTISVNEFGKQIPYIKSNNKKIYFCGALVEGLLHDTITKYLHSYMKKGDIFAYWQNDFPLSEAVIKERKSTTYILSDLYYLRENATYYLDRTFVIKLK